MVEEKLKFIGNATVAVGLQTMHLVPYWMKKHLEESGQENATEKDLKCSLEVCSWIYMSSSYTLYGWKYLKSLFVWQPAGLGHRRLEKNYASLLLGVMWVE